MIKIIYKRLNENNNKKFNSFIIQLIQWKLLPMKLLPLGFRNYISGEMVFNFKTKLVEDKRGFYHIYPKFSEEQLDEYLKTLVGKGASIGANATIICGNNIGKYAFIDAGAVVTKEVLPYALVVGNPAKQIGWISEFGHRLELNENNQATCPESGETYRLIKNRIHKA